MIVRPETPADACGVHRVVAQAFGREDEAALVASLRRSGDAAISLVADDDGAVIGHVMFSKMTAPFPALGMAPVAVAPAHQRRGVGARLITDGLELAREGEWRAVFVLGEPAYYGRFGFDARLAAGFECAYAGPYFMALALNGAPPAAAGQVAYPPAFSSFD